MDLLTQSPGTHTISCLFLGFLRPYLLAFIFGRSYEKLQLSIYDIRVDKKLLFIFLIVLLHHLIFFTIEYFSFKHSLLILKYTFLTLPFTYILILIYITLLQRVKND